MITREIQDLYLAAFMLSVGGRLIETTGSYPKSTFVIEEGNWLYRLRMKLNLVDWRVFKKHRLNLKKYSLSGEYRKCKTMKELLTVYKKRNEMD